MSSRLFRSGDPVNAAPVMWKHAGGAPVQDLRSAPQARQQTNESVMAELERSTQARIEAAFQRGRAEGEAAGAERAARQIEPVIAGFNAIVHELASLRNRLRAEAEEDLVQLALAIARRILYRELATDPMAILGLVKAAASKLNARETHRVRVAPSDAQLLLQHRHELDLPPAVEIIGDSSLPTGSAIFETSRGELDASVDTQLAEIDRGLTDVMKRRPR